MQFFGSNYPYSLPLWLPGESFFSLICRYHRLTGNHLPELSSQALFGHRHQGSQHDLPNRLGIFCNRTHNILGDSETIARQKTILPFYLPFRNSDVANSAVQAMEGSGGGMLKYRLGILTSRFRANHPLKACQQCIEEDIEHHGVAYWHLEHQFPGTWICLRHQQMLAQALKKSTGVARFDWVLPDRAQLEQVGLRSCLTANAAALSRLAELVNHVVALPQGLYLTSETLMDAYRLALIDQGLIKSNGRLDLHSLSRTFSAAISPLRIVPELSSLACSEGEATNHLGRWLRKPRGGTHPLRHLAIIYWLFPDWQAFWQTYQSITAKPNACAPIQTAHSPPLDPRHTRLLELLENGKSVTHASKALNIAVSTAMAWAAKHGAAASRRPKSLKGEKLQELIRLLKSGIDKQIAAEQFAVSVVTITRIMRSEAGLQEAWHASRTEQTREAYRANWLAVMQDNPLEGIKLLRALAPNAYAWLYRNDKEWFKCQKDLIPARQKSSIKPRLDWDLRDASLSAEVYRIASEIAAKTGKERIFLWQIYQVLPELKAKLGALAKLPLTKKAIESTTHRRNRKNTTNTLF